MLLHLAFIYRYRLYYLCFVKIFICHYNETRYITQDRIDLKQENFLHHPKLLKENTLLKRFVNVIVIVVFIVIDIVLTYFQYNTCADTSFLNLYLNPNTK